MFGYAFNKATEVGYLLVLNTKLTSKSELTSFFGKTLAQLQADTRVLATASPGNALILSEPASDATKAIDRHPRFNRRYRGYLSASSAVMTFLRNGEIKGVVLVFGNPGKRAAFMEFGDGKEITSSHKYISVDSPSASMTFTFPYLDTI